MFRPLRIIWIALLAITAYVVYRWWRQQARESFTLPASAPLQTPTRPAPLPPVKSSTPATATPAPVPGAPRRIPTRVHRGAPPSTSLAQQAPPEQPAAPDVAPAAETVAPAPVPEPPLAETPAAPLVSLPEQAGEEIPLGAPLADEAGITTGLLDLNAADIEALIDLPGIGPALAQRIIDYRMEKGAFTSIEQLTEIAGIGPNNLNEFRHLVRI